MDFNLKNFKTIGGVIEALEKVSDVAEVNDLLFIYNQTMKHDLPSPKHPVIVLEGLDGAGKSTMVEKLAYKFLAPIIRTPPLCIEHLRPFFLTCPELLPAYYSLGNYLASVEISHRSQTRPVIVDRFWHSTMAYALANHQPDLEENDDIYTWPVDLLKPTLSIYMDVNERIRLNRKNNSSKQTEEEVRLAKDRKFREMIISSYKKMHNIIIINSDALFETNFKVLCSLILPHVKEFAILYPIRKRENEDDDDDDHTDEEPTSTKRGSEDDSSEDEGEIRSTDYFDDGAPVRHYLMSGLKRRLLMPE